MKQFRNPINKYFCILKPNFTGGEDKVKVNDLEDIVRLILKLYNDVPDNLKVWIDNHYTNPTAFGKEYQYAFMVFKMCRKTHRIKQYIGRDCRLHRWRG